LLFACSFPGSTLSTVGVPMLTPWWPGMSLAAISCTALLWHRSRPRVTTTITILCVMGMAVLGYVLTVLLLAPLMAALYSLATRTDQRTERVFTLAAIVTVVGAALLAGPAKERWPSRRSAPSPGCSCRSPSLRDQAAASLSGGRAGPRRVRRTDPRGGSQAPRRRGARAHRPRAPRRRRPPPALANAQAGTVAHLMRTHPDQAEKIVNELTGTTSSALREMKAVVGLLRQADDPEAPLEPAPGLDRLSDLAASFASAGLTVTLITEGQPRPLSPGVDLTAYRIVQEARR